MSGEITVADSGLTAAVVGSGPVVLLCPGGDGDSDAVTALAAHLASDWTVVIPRRRAYSVESESAGIQPPSISDYADDFGAVLASVADGPAHVVASSFGAAIALELLIRHPARVARLVAHEPPVADLLPEPDRTRFATELHEMHARFGEGIMTAMPPMAAFAGLRFDEWEPGAAPPPGPPDPRRMQALERFFLALAPSLERYRPDTAAIRALADRVMPATGTTSSDHFPYRVAEALGALVDVPVARFPGAHNGMTTHPKAFAETLRTLLLP